jgi:hypothetical protein
MFRRGAIGDIGLSGRFDVYTRSNCAHISLIYEPFIEQRKPKGII